MTDNAIEHVRSFNRAVTERIGALQDEYLARGRPLGASRVLWEVGREGTDLRALRARLDPDSGYLRRLARAAPPPPRRGPGRPRGARRAQRRARALVPRAARRAAARAAARGDG